MESPQRPMEAGLSHQKEWKLLYFIFENVKLNSQYNIPVVSAMPKKTRASEN